MAKIVSWLKKLKSSTPYQKPQRFVDIKRASIKVDFLTPGHPLYDNLLAKEENKLRILAPNDTAFDETSLIHNFVATVLYNDESYLIINSFKHFKEQSIGGLLQYDENIFNIIPFYETDDEYKTAHDYTFAETYEYDHPVETYFLSFHSSQNSGKITLNRGKTPIDIKMIDQQRKLFTENLTPKEIEMIDYIVIPSLEAFATLQNQKKQ